MNRVLLSLICLAGVAAGGILIWKAVLPLIGNILLPLSQLISALM